MFFFDLDISNAGTGAKKIIKTQCAEKSEKSKKSK
jgi:hypothetical protein